MSQQFSTKERILGAAEELFALHGFSGTSLRQVTSRADVNIAAVNYHFGSKENLVNEVFRRRMDVMSAQRLAQLRQALCAHHVHAPPEDLVDQVFLAAEVVVDGRDVDVGAAGDLAQGRAGEAVQGEQFLGRAQDPLLRRELLAHALLQSNACLILGVATGRCKPVTCIAGQSVRITAALSAKPASARGFFHVNLAASRVSGPCPEKIHGAGAHPVHHQA